ncbi:MAG: hypothetical protein FGM62_06950 [Methylobacterium sp.]|nr:hypothetical protein [Methylobacterium sp.]
MQANKKALAIVIGGTFAASLALSPVAGAAENPFAFKPLSSGYMLADNHAGDTKMEDGACGEGKCGSSMKKKSKAKEGSCGGDKAKEGSCGGDKAKEAKCGAEKAKEASCGGEKK